jgi:hypothetical protein
MSQTGGRIIRSPFRTLKTGLSRSMGKRANPLLTKVILEFFFSMGAA